MYTPVGNFQSKWTQELAYKSYVLETKDEKRILSAVNAGKASYWQIYGLWVYKLTRQSISR